MSHGYTMKPAGETTVILRGEAVRYARMSGAELWAELKTRDLPQWQMARLITPHDTMKALLQDDRARAEAEARIAAEMIASAETLDFDDDDDDDDEPAGATPEQIAAMLADEGDLDG